MYSLLHLECHSISIFDLSLICLFNGKWYKRHKESDHQLRFAKAEMTLQTQ